MRHLYVCLSFLLCFNCFADNGVVNYTVNITSRLGPIAIPKGEKPFIVFDAKDTPVIYFDELPYQDMSMRCENMTSSEYAYFPVYPRIYFLPCPSRTLIAKNNNDIVWKFPLDDYEGEPIGYSPNGIILHSFNKGKIDVISFDDGKLLQTFPSANVCTDYPGSAFYDKGNNTLYVYCKEGTLKSIHFQTKEVATVFEPERQFLSKVAPDFANMKLDSSGRFIIFSESMPSRLSSWGGVAVYDILNKEVIFRERIYRWALHVDVAMGKNKDFAIAYRCGDDNSDKVCGTYYQITPKK
jgi:hypothetical protein